MVQRGRIARRYGGSSYRSGLGAAAKSAIALALKGYKSYTATKSQQKAKTNQFSTSSHYDTRQMYRRKRMPRRRRRRWVRFLRRNLAADMKSQPTYTFTFNDNWTTSWESFANSGNQEHFCMQLYSFNGSGGIRRDVKQIMNQSVWGQLPPDNYSVLFSTGVIDITGQFTYGFTDNASGFTGSCTCEVDLYVIEHGNIGSIAYSTWNTELTDIESDSGGNVDLRTRGVTPFQLPAFGNGAHRLRIISKRRWTLGNGQSFTYQYRDTRNRIVNGSEVSPTNQDSIPASYRKAYMTKSFLLVYKLITSVPVSFDPDGFQAALTIGHTRNYTCKKSLMSSNESQAFAVSS